MNQNQIDLSLIIPCCNERTVELIKSLTDGHSNRRFLLYERNMGRGRSVADGIRISRRRVVGFIDIDLEVHARYIPLCIC